MCPHWLQLLIKLPFMHLAHQEGHSLPHTVSLLLFFMFMGIRWFVEGATPRRAHPVRSAEKTTAAPRCPSFWELRAWPSVHPGHTPSLPPALLLLLCPCSSFKPAQSAVYQHRPEHSAASRNTHGSGAAIPHPAVNTFPCTVCRCQSCAHTHILTPSYQHSCSLLPGAWPSVLHNTCILCGFFSRVLTAEAHTHGPGQHTLCSLTQAVSLPTTTVV